MYKNREMLWDLAVNDFSTKYAGSYLGIFWAFVQPLITILVYWCVFEFGLKAVPPVPDVTYVVWFSAGMVPWFFFSDGLNAVMNGLLEYSYLVKKVVFDVELIPIVKLMSALFVHSVFVALLGLLAWGNGTRVSASCLQVFYYMLCLVYLVYAAGRFAAAIILFIKDLGQIVNIILQIGVWVTPIIWSYTIVAEKWQWVVKLNPMFYIVEGYRDSFINRRWFFERPVLSAYFWMTVILALGIGHISFRKLKPHFADVL